MDGRACKDLGAGANKSHPSIISFSAELEAYVKGKGIDVLEVSIVDARTCCSGYCEVLVVPLKGDAAQMARERAVRLLATDVCDVAMVSRGIDVDEVVHFGLSSFLGVKDVTVTGMRAFSLR